MVAEKEAGRWIDRGRETDRQTESFILTDH